MFGAIVGDFIGSVWEGSDPFEFCGPLLNPDCLFTDDTVLTITTAYALAVGQTLSAKYRESILDYRDLGFSEAMLQWAEGRDEHQYFNLGNGAAIRVSLIHLFADRLGEAMRLARESASATHYQELPIRLAEVIGGATFLSHRNASPAEVRKFVDRQFPELSQWPRSGIPYQWESVFTAIEIACNTRSFDSCMRECISAGGDVDSVCAMAGGISDGFWGCPPELSTQVLDRLETLHPDLFSMLRVAIIGVPNMLNGEPLGLELGGSG